MTFEIAALLTQDGIATGAVYAMIALGVVLVFNVTRIVFVSFGDLIAYSALTLATIQLDRLPGTIWLVILLAAAAFCLEAFDLVRHNRIAQLPKAFLTYCVIPMLPVAATVMLQGRYLPMGFQIALTLALILPIGPLIFRVVFRPMLNASVLALLMAAVALHFALAGLALLFFGAEGFKTKPYIGGSSHFASLDIPNETLIIVGAVIALIVALYAFFGSTLTGKALRATAINPVGARLVGIRPTTAGSIAFLLATATAAVSGILIGPTITVYYDTGFLIGLKGFVGAVVGGFISYPMAGVGALIIGLVESFSAFYSSAFKDAIVFAALIPIVLLRWLSTRSEHDEEEEEDL
jgi:branched-chain amino acid transport system permease protein